MAHGAGVGRRPQPGRPWSPCTPSSPGDGPNQGGHAGCCVLRPQRALGVVPSGIWLARRAMSTLLNFFFEKWATVLMNPRRPGRARFRALGRGEASSMSRHLQASARPPLPGDHVTMPPRRSSTEGAGIVTSASAPAAAAPTRALQVPRASQGRRRGRA